MRIDKIIISLCLIVVLAFISACTPNEVDQLEGIIQNVDAAKGEITIVTKDGQTVTLNIDTEAQVEAQGSPSTIDTLEIGASIQVEVNEDNQVVQRIEVHQAEEEVVENVEVVEEVDTEDKVEIEDEESIDENTAEISSLSDDDKVTGEEKT